VLAAALLREYLDKVRLATAGLGDDELWYRPAAGTNSVGNLLLHLAGNLSLWLLAGVGGRAFERHRAAEFAADRAAGREELLGRLATVVEEAAALLDDLADADLTRRLTVQGYETDLLSAILHPVEHMSYHAGQIVWIAKHHLAARGEGLEFYPHHAKE
jgi:uncharacterized damage-inducible protein DinB